MSHFLMPPPDGRSPKLLSRRVAPLPVHGTWIAASGSVFGKAVHCPFV